MLPFFGEKTSYASEDLTPGRFKVCGGGVWWRCMVEVCGGGVWWRCGGSVSWRCMVEVHGGGA